MLFVLDDAIVSFQVVCVNSFSQMLRRYTSLNHLAQAAHAVLQNSAHINQMLSDLNRVDFNNVQVRAALPLLRGCGAMEIKGVLSVRCPLRSRHPGFASVKTASCCVCSRTLR